MTIIHKPSSLMTLVVCVCVCVPHMFFVCLHTIAGYIAPVL